MADDAAAKASAAASGSGQSVGAADAAAAKAKDVAADVTDKADKAAAEGQGHRRREPPEGVIADSAASTASAAADAADKQGQGKRLPGAVVRALVRRRCDIAGSSSAWWLLPLSDSRSRRIQRRIRHRRIVRGRARSRSSGRGTSAVAQARAHHRPAVRDARPIYAGRRGRWSRSVSSAWRGSPRPAPADRRLASESGAGSHRHRAVRLPVLTLTHRVSQLPLPLAIPLGAPRRRLSTGCPGSGPHPFDGRFAAPAFAVLLGAGFSLRIVAVVQAVLGITAHLNVSLRATPPPEDQLLERA